MCFSGRRRHTSWPRDWSSDVCSSDLKRVGHSIFLYKILFVELIQQGNDRRAVPDAFQVEVFALAGGARPGKGDKGRSEEHTSELQSRGHLVCRLLLEKKKRHNNKRRG